jgi:tape measure domain-containing protein
MANQTYIIKFRADGLAEVDKGMRNTSRSALNLGSALRGLAAYLGTREILRYADAWTSLSNKIRIVAKDHEDLIETRKELIAVSNRSFSSIQGNVTLYQRLAMANRSLNKTQKELIQFTEAVSKSLTISGATGEETRSVLLQLSQGLGSTAVRGEEFRAVMEAAPRLMKALSDSTGLSIQQIKELTAEGKFLSKDFFEAVLKQTAQIEEDFSKIAPTLSQSLAVVGNNLTIFFGKMNDATGVTRGFGKILITLSEHLNKIAVAGGLLAAVKLAKWASGVNISFTALNATLAKTFISMAKVVAIVGAFFVAYEAGRTFFESTRSGALLMQRLANSFELLQFRMENWHSSLKGQELDDYKFKLAQLQLAHKQTIEEIQNADFGGDGANFETFVDNVTTDLNTLLGKLTDVRIEIEKMGDGGQQEELSQFVKDFNSEWVKFGETIKSVGETLGVTFTTAIRGISDEFANMVVDGKADFKALAQSVVKDLIRMTTQALIFKAVSGFAGTGAGGALGLGNAFATRQFGGPVQAGQPTLVGERRPEIFVPQTAGRIEPYPKAQEASSPAIVNVLDEAMFHDAMASTAGQKIIMNVISRNKASLA